MHEHFSIYNGWMIPISRAIDDFGIDFEQTLQNCNIKPEDFRDNESRVSAEKLSALLAYCNKAVNRKDFGIVIAKNFHPGMFHALGYSMMSSNSVKDALLRIARYKKVVSNTCTLTTEERQNSFYLNMDVYKYDDSKRPILGCKLIECFLATLVQFCREALKSDFSPKAVHLNWPKPQNDISYLSNFFNCDIVFDSPTIAIEFDAKSIATPLIGGNPLLTQTHEKMLDDYITRLDKNDVVQLVKNYIHEVLSLGTPAQTDVANKLCMSLRTLQRKLNDRETSFRDVLEQTRKKLALDYITQQHLMFSEIGYLLGFSTVGNFNRAFKRWTDCTPGEYRKSHC